MAAIWSLEHRAPNDFNYSFSFNGKTRVAETRHPGSIPRKGIAILPVLLEKMEVWKWSENENQEEKQNHCLRNLTGRVADF